MMNLRFVCVVAVACSLLCSYGIASSSPKIIRDLFGNTSFSNTPVEFKEVTNEEYSTPRLIKKRQGDEYGRDSTDAHGIHNFVDVSKQRSGSLSQDKDKVGLMQTKYIESYPVASNSAVENNRTNTESRQMVVAPFEMSGNKIATDPIKIPTLGIDTLNSGSVLPNPFTVERCKALVTPSKMDISKTPAITEQGFTPVKYTITCICQNNKSPKKILRRIMDENEEREFEISMLKISERKITHVVEKDRMFTQTRNSSTPTLDMNNVKSEMSSNQLTNTCYKNITTSLIVRKEHGKSSVKRKISVMFGNINKGRMDQLSQSSKSKVKTGFCPSSEQQNVPMNDTISDNNSAIQSKSESEHDNEKRDMLMGAISSVNIDNVLLRELHKNKELNKSASELHSIDNTITGTANNRQHNKASILLSEKDMQVFTSKQVQNKLKDDAFEKEQKARKVAKAIKNYLIAKYKESLEKQVKKILSSNCEISISEKKVIINYKRPHDINKICPTTANNIGISCLTKVRLLMELMRDKNTKDDLQHLTGYERKKVTILNKASKKEVNV